MRFCTVPRDTRKDLASCATIARALDRMSEISCQSTSSKMAHPECPRGPVATGWLAYRQPRLAFCATVPTNQADFWLFSGGAAPENTLAAPTPVPQEAPMIDYLGLAEMRRLIGELGVAEVIAGLAEEIENDYRRWPEFETSARLASHSSLGVIELMPTSDGRQFSFKYVNGHPKNTAEGLLTVTAFGVLADVATGYPVLLSEMTLTTALRTAAMSALAARWMARPEARVMALIGNGAQSEFQAIGFHRLLGIRELRLYDVDAAATAKLERNLRASGYDFETVRARSAAEAAHGADILTTVTADKRNAVIVTPAMVAAGMHVNAIGGDCPGKTELHRDVLLRGDARVVVEYEPQSRIEGEV